MVCHDHRSDRQTDSSETAPPVARRRRVGSAVAGPVWHKSRRPWIQGLCLGGAGRTHRRSGYRRVVGVPQPGGLVRALGRHRADDRHPGRGDNEVVACYDLTTGQPVWTRRDAARFFESNGGAGPRGTPIVSNGRVYAFGATGILNALDAGKGVAVWSRNVASDTGTKVPYWGFSSSPLVVDDLVIVAAAGQLVAYDLATGVRRWSGPAGEGYSSPHLVTIDGVAQILLMSGAGATSVAPTNGRVLWEHAWKGFPIVQPAVTADGDILIVAST